MRTDRPLLAELRRGFLTGVAVIVPLMITIIVLTIAFNYVYQYLDLISDAILPFSPAVSLPIVGVIGREPLVEIATPIVLLLLILGVGVTVNSSRYGALAVDYFDYVIERVPGIGSVYESFRRMSDVMLESDGENFQEVVLVEFPTADAYTLAFVTSNTPETIAEPAGRGDEGMRTLFMPMAPNPVMGGHVLFVPESRIVDIDLTVEEGIQALVTSGVAIGGGGIGDGVGTQSGETRVSAETLQDISRLDHIEQRIDPTATARATTSADRMMTGRRERYDDAVNPREAETPDAIVRRERDHAVDDDATQGSTPAERADRRESDRATTDTPPSKRAVRDPADSDSTTVPPERHDELGGEDGMERNAGNGNTETETDEEDPS